MGSLKQCSIVIADDQMVLAEGLSAVLANYSDFKVIAIVSNGEKLLQLLNDKQPDLILLDLNMPVMDGFAACEKIGRLFPKIVVVALTSYDDNKIRKRVQDAGAAGMLLKYMTSGELVDTLRKIMNVGNGQFFFTSDTQMTATASFSEYDSDKFVTQYQLSEQESKIVRLVAAGSTSEEIGDRLSISKHTVDTHRRNILHKLKLKNTPELIDFMHKYIQS